MANESDPRDPRNFLRAGEELLWEGRPDPGGQATGAVRYLGCVGYLMLAIFAFFLAMGWANRDELEGGETILLIFLLISGGTGIAFLFGVPALSRAILKSTRYAVAGHSALIIQGVFGNTEVLRYPLPVGQQVRTLTDKAGRETVVFAWVRANVGTTQPGHRRRVTKAIGFERLTAEAGAAARGALEQIRGKAGADAKFERERIK